MRPHPRAGFTPGSYPQNPPVATSCPICSRAKRPEILTLAGETGAGLIILGTHGRKGLAHVFLGSTAEKVVRLAECPVFVVKEGRPSAVHEEKVEAEPAAAV